MKVTISVNNYPSSFKFKTEDDLPEFEYGCSERTNRLHQAMHDLNIDSPCHAYEDYIVEAVKKDKAGNETWTLGS